MPTEGKKQPSSAPWIAAVAIGLILIVVLWSNYKQGPGFDKPVITGPQQYHDVQQQAERLSLQHLKDLDAGIPLTETAKQDLQHAAVLFDGLIDAQPENLALYVGAGKIYQALGNDDAAIKRFQLGLSKVGFSPHPAIRDTAVEGYYLLSLSLFNVKAYDEALKQVNVSIKLFPSSPIYFTHRASIYIQQKKYSDATHDLLKALSIDDQYKPALSRLKLIGLSLTDAALQSAKEKLNKKDFKGAIADCSKGLSVNPTDPALLSVRAAAYIGVKQTANARADVETIRANYPDYKDLAALDKMLK